MWKCLKLILGSIWPLLSQTLTPPVHVSLRMRTEVNLSGRKKFYPADIYMYMYIALVHGYTTMHIRVALV